jgi:hypothetical protein
MLVIPLGRVHAELLIQPAVAAQPAVNQSRSESRERQTTALGPKQSKRS